MVKSKPSAVEDLNIQRIAYSLDGRGATCTMMQFLCAEFGKADNSYPSYPQLPFTVEGVMSADDSGPAPEHLIGCTPFLSCECKSHVFQCSKVI